MYQRRTAHPVGVIGGEAKSVCGGPGQLGDAAGVADEVWRLEVGEVADRSQHVVEFGLVDGSSQARLAVEDLRPVALLVQAVEDGSAVGAQQVNEVGVELFAGAFAGHAQGGVCAAHPLERGDHIGEIDQPGGESDLLAPESRGAAAVPAFVALDQAAAHLLAQAELLCQRVGGLPVALQGRGEPAQPGDRERDRSPHLVGERAAAAQLSHQETGQVCCTVAGEHGLALHDLSLGGARTD
ncbi:hypothetical protein [Nocardioides speluncae]|uniref:hypothetical protein n=1 Tax=Nocardioides speluncae TaxID=2670337 RepID=UPI001F0BE143|nr:hypothetical protein [Nocardioides speluncae]